MKIKTIFQYLFFGIAWGCVFFVIYCLIVFCMAGEEYLQPIVHDYARQAIGAMLAGIFCGSTAIVYTVDKLPLGIKILIHFAVGLGGYFGVAYVCGWIPLQSTGRLAAFAAIGITVFTLIWLGFYLYNRWEANKVNRRLRELEARENETLQ